MGNSKQDSSISTSHVGLDKDSSRKAKPSNGTSNDDQLVDEVKKLDQIRDMLFGEHVATLQNSYQILDQSLDQNIADLRNELTTSVAELKKQIDKKFDQLKKHLQSEEQDRITQNEELVTKLSNVNLDILTKLDLEAKRVNQALDDQHHESTRQLNSMVDSLSDAKVDRKSLAILFNQFAKELEGS